MIEKTKDFEIREALKASSYIASLKEEDPKTLVIEEFSLGRLDSRIDMAVFNGCLHGFEIKSDVDTLARLPIQSSNYDKIFDYVCLIVGVRYYKKALNFIPSHWGVYIAEKKGCFVNITEERRSLPNTIQDSYAIASLLWRTEIVTLLDKYGLLNGFKSKPCRILWARLAEELSLRDLKSEVRSVIKARGDWRSVMRQQKCGEKSRPSAKSSHFLYPLPL